MSETEHTGVGIDEIVVSRDDEGLIVPEEVFIEEFDDTVVARPMNEAAKDKYIRPFAEASMAAEAMYSGEVEREELSDEQREELEELGQNALSDGMLAEMFDEHIVEPDLVAAYDANRPERDIDELDEEFVSEELKVGAKDGLLFAVLLASDMEEFVEALRGNVDPEDEEVGEGDEGN